MAEVNPQPDCGIEGFSHPIYENGRYRNPWESWRDLQLGKLFKFFFLTKSESNIPTDQELEDTLPVIKPDLSTFKTSPVLGVRHMWIGHASSLVQIDGITLLTDPVFSDRCSPVSWLGPRRYRPPPCSVEDLPHIDCVIISHNHYDHLDYPTVLALNSRFGDNLRWYVPMGLKQWMHDSGCNNVIELSWWQEHIHSEESQVKIVSTPCQHWSKRYLMDTNKVLWTSWCVIGPKNRFFFAGDTGYCDGFKQIGQCYGPFTLSTIPIGAYKPRWALSPQHVDPKEAVAIHNDVRSQTSIGIHWGTFALGAKEFYLQPRELLEQEFAANGAEQTSFITVRHGEILVLGGDSKGNN